MAKDEELRAENQALRARIAALEAELEARPRVERAPMFALLDAMPMLVAAISQDGVCEYVSPAFRPWLLGRRRDVVGAAFADRLAPSLRPLAEALIAEALEGRLAQREVSLPDRDGRRRDLQVTVAPRRIGGDNVNGCIVVGHDLTPLRVADEALRASEQRFRLAAEAAGLGVFDRDLATNAILYSAQARAMFGFPAEGPVTLGMIRDATHPDDLPGVIAAALRAMDPALRERAPCDYRVVRPDGEVRWVTAYAEAIFETHEGAEVAVRLVGLLQDVTDRTVAAHRQQLMLNELNHRVKNTLASVQSIVRLALRDGQSLPAARDRLTDRLIALAGAHDILTRESWQAADLAELVRVSIAPYCAAGAERFAMEGPRVRVNPKAAVALALALHELATNAAKYGALSTSAGTVAIVWRLEDGGARLVLDWGEAGGPPVKPPTRSGFGTRLLTRGLATEFGGVARLDFAPGGVTCRIEAPLGAEDMLQLP